MAEKYVIVSHQFLKPIKILSWKVRKGSYVNIGKVVLLYDDAQTDKKEQLRFKSTHAGIVSKLIATAGAIIQSGDPLFELQPCQHSTVIRDLCAECGADLRIDEIKSTASVPMIHSEPDLKVSKEIAQKIGKADNDHLLKTRKLVLLVDLDQTLIHTTNDRILENILDVYHFQLYGQNSPWYHTKLRPGTIDFLKSVSQYFELHICTFGARNYAHRITAILDPDNKLFSQRVLSRDECFDPTSKTANLKALFPCGDNMVCIIDDREDVWSYVSNLIHVKPYHFFKHTGDINAPPGFSKRENDVKDSDVSIEQAPRVQIENKGSENCEQISNIEVLSESKSKNNVEHITVEETKESKEQIFANGTTGNVVKCDEIKQKNIISDDNTTRENVNNLESDQIKQENAIFLEIKQTIVKCNETIQESDKTDLEDAVDKKVEEISCIEKFKENNDKSLPVVIGTNTVDLALPNPTIPVKKVEDPDDYLLYLEDILKRIHQAFYQEYDSALSGEVPDLKTIIPAVKRKILEGCNLIFSGLVPTHIRLEKSKAFQIAKSLGANVSEEFNENTTHLVAVRPGTAKVNAGKKIKNVKIVTPDWLWTCAERWEHVNENIFPLSSKGSRNRHPPPHCSSPEHTINYEVHDLPGSRKRSPSGRFIDSINPLMSFSSDDIADMDKDVDDALDDDDSESEADKQFDKHDSSSSSSSEGFSSMKVNRKRKRLGGFDDETDTRDTDELPVVKFFRGEQTDSDFEVEKKSDDESDIDWDNSLGECLEREFRSE